MIDYDERKKGSVHKDVRASCRVPVYKAKIHRKGCTNCRGNNLIEGIDTQRITTGK